jgi:hypothetical protein
MDGDYGSLYRDFYAVSFSMLYYVTHHQTGIGKRTLGNACRDSAYGIRTFSLLFDYNDGSAVPFMIGGDAICASPLDF